MRRLCGPLLMATGVLDILYVLIFHLRQIAAIAGDGFVNAVEPNVSFSTLDREVAFWHFTFGATVLILGALIHWAQNRTWTLPAFLGWAVLAIGAGGVILMPVSGFWIVLPQGVLMILAARQAPSPAAAQEFGGKSRPADSMADGRPAGRRI